MSFNYLSVFSLNEYIFSKMGINCKISNFNTNLKQINDKRTLVDL